MSWFLTCKLFHGMITAETIHTHSVPHVLSRDGLYWDGPISRPARFRGRLGVLLRTQDCERLPQRDWPAEVWAAVLKDTQDESWVTTETRDYVIEQEEEFLPKHDGFSPRLEWVVLWKPRFTFYTRPDIVDYRKLGPRDINNTFKNLGDFPKDVIEWHGCY